MKIICKYPELGNIEQQTEAYKAILLNVLDVRSKIAQRRQDILELEEELVKLTQAQKDLSPLFTVVDDEIKPKKEIKNVCNTAIINHSDARY